VGEARRGVKSASADRPRLTASTTDQVDAFHAAALAAGGRDNGAPGERPYGYYYAAFVLDPDGHNLEAVYHRR
jgi:predicted lactoylglutathione lyase